MSRPFRGLLRGRRGLNLQLIGLIVVPLTVVLLTVTLGSIALHHEALRTLLARRNQREASLGAGVLSSELSRRADRIRGLAAGRGPAVAGSGPATPLGPDDELFPAGWALFARDGTPMSTTPGGVDWDLDALADVLARAGVRPVFSAAFAVPRSGAELALVAVATDGGRIAVGAFAPADVARTVLDRGIAPDNPSQSAIVVLDARHRILFSTGALTPRSDLATHPGVAEALAGRTGSTFVDIGDGEHIVAYSAIAPAGWAILTEEAWPAIANPVLRPTLAIPLVLVPALIMALVLLWFGARQIVVPLQDLSARAGALAAGDVAEIERPVGGIVEIRRLQTELAAAARRIHDVQQGLRDYIGAITLGQEEERRRLARELHDDTLQSLVALGQRIQLLRLAPPAANEGALDALQEMVERTITDVRRFTRALRPVYLEDLGLVPALEMLARESADIGGPPAIFHAEGVERRLAPDIELSLYRLAQEALNNAIRHASATRIDLSIAFEPARVIVTVSDDGCGFTPPLDPVRRGGHFGLLHLRERADLIGAHLAIDSALGQGTRVAIELPDP